MVLLVLTREAYMKGIVKYTSGILFYTFSGVVFYNIVKHVKDPFIDEIFHLRQCQVYCSLNFKHWDNKITTPPGLYILGFLYSKLLDFITAQKNLCQSYNVLRSLNLFGGLIILPIVLKNFKRSNYNQFWTVNVIAQPLIFTYYFLFYTDTWSAIFVLISLTLINTRSSQRPYWSAGFGFLSLWMRQTNIIWLAFIAAVYIDRQILRDSGVPNRISQFVKKCFQNWTNMSGYITCFGIFAVFLVVNKGITFGDKDNHQMQLHLVQLFYCFAFINFFTWPVWLTKRSVQSYIRFWKTNHGVNFAINGLCLGCIYYIIQNYTVVHPFLLADNRHYTFYIFKRLLSHKLSAIIAAPVYHFSICNMVRSFYRTKKLNLSPITILAYFTAAVLTLVPSPLFEPRYYLIPLLVFRLHIHSAYEYANLIEFFWLNIINLTTSYIFFHYEFTWLSEPNRIQRIIW